MSFYVSDITVYIVNNLRQVVMVNALKLDQKLSAKETKTNRADPDQIASEEAV